MVVNSNFGLDLPDWLTGAVKTVDNLINPPRPATVATVPVQAAVQSAPLFTVAGISVTPVKLLLAVGVAAGIAYLARRK